MLSASKDLPLYRNLLLIAASVYLLWWLAINLFLENAYNPFLSRLAVSCLFALIWALSFRISWVRRHIQGLYFSAVWILTLHFFYLFYANGGDNNWVIGAFITILAITYCFFSLRPLVIYSFFVFFLSIAMLAALTALQHSVFFPGILTILLQANISLAARLRVIKRLTESNERFQLLFHSASEGVLLHENRIIMNANEALAHMLGFSVYELIGKNVFDLLEPGSRAYSAERISAADPTPYETRGLRKDGSEIDIEVRAKDILYEGKTLRLVTARDLTDRKRVERERINAQAMREKISALDEFISLASHELKTPLTSLKLWIQMISRSIRNKDFPNAERTREILDLVNKQISRISSLVETMLDVSQISSARLKIERKPVDISSLAQELVRVLRPQSEALGCSIELEAAPTIRMEGDSARLTQVIENLLVNSMKYGNRKPIYLSLSTEGGEAVIRVRDQGLGIEPENLKRIFERFERVPSEKNISGLGLGLFLTKTIVIAHGGTINVESELGQGSLFTVKIPLAQGA